MFITYKVVVDDNKTIRWYLNDKLHRVDGPAVEFADGNKYWFLDSIPYTEANYNKEINRRKQPEAVELTVADIEKLLGKKVKIVKG